MVYKIAWTEISINRAVHRTVKQTLDSPFSILFCKFHISHKKTFKNPNDKRAAFTIDKTEDDNAAQKLYTVISEMTSGRMNKLNLKCLGDSN